MSRQLRREQANAIPVTSDDFDLKVNDTNLRRRMLMKNPTFAPGKTAYKNNIDFTDTYIALNEVEIQRRKLR